MQSPGVKSATRVLELLELFAEHRRPLKVGEVAALLGIPQSSTSVLLKSLRELGYLAFDRAARGYLPTLRVALLGGWLEQEWPVHASVLALTDDLHRRLGDTLLLGIERGIHVQYIRVLEATRPIRFHLKPNTMRLLPHANVGLVLLALKSDQEVERLVRRIRAERGADAARFTEPQVLRMVAQVRADGYSCTPDIMMDGASVIAMPLPAEPVGYPLGIGVGGPTDRILRERDGLVREMRAAIARHLPAGRAAAGAATERRGARRA
jgi:DNA-binding IclR family transcriptional regulator